MIDFADVYYKMVAMSYADELKEAIVAQRMGDSESYHRLTDYVMQAAQCELWELVEALDIVNNADFQGENPFAKRLGSANNIHQIAQDEAAKADKLRNIWARKNINKNDKEGAILARQERAEHFI